VNTAFYQPIGASELLPRYAFLEALVAGRRVLEVGAAAATGGRGASFLRSRGAASVLSLDSDPVAIDAVQRELASDPALRFQSGRVEDLADATYDLILVADAAPLVRAPSTLDRLARLLSKDGHLALGLRNFAGTSLAVLCGDEPREGVPTWGELVAALESRFAVVEAATQLAFVGYRLGPAGVTDLETAVDATAQGAEDCGYYLAIAGSRLSGALGAEIIVALPAAPLTVAAQRRAELAERLRLSQEEMDRVRSRAGALPPSEAELRIRELESALSAAHLRARRLERDAETLTALERSARERAEQAEETLARAAAPKPPGA
jgi:SAM-dependent methyltransferase